MTRLPATLLLIALAVNAGERAPVAPFEAGGKFVARNAVDHALLQGLRRHGLRPAPPCSDAVFVRRVFLDGIGTLPSADEVVEFLKDERPDKRARLIAALLERDEFADYAALKWCDVLRVKAEFPINLWPNAVQAYHRWVHDAIRTNRPYDEFARELLTASGSNFRVPAVNFWRACPSREPAALAQAVALTLMGVRYENLPADRQEGLAALCSRVAFKRTIEWKEEIVLLDPEPTGALAAVLPDGKKATVPAGADPRKALADWLIRRDNPWFARNVCNRIWAWLMGRGIIHEPDDFRPDNPPSNPALLDALAKELVRSGWDLRAVYRLILESSTYQQSPVPRAPHPKATELFAHYPPRRLDAEVLIDAICAITGTTEKYASPIPEPFTFLPEDDRSIKLEDGSISSPFLEMFGRPTRDTGLWSERNNDMTGAARLHLLNSSDIQARIERSQRIRFALRGKRGVGALRALYLMILSRPPTNAEVEAIARYAREAKLNPKQVTDDLVWALINSKEFLYAH
jgi:hypothetical protein